MSRKAPDPPPEKTRPNGPPPPPRKIHPVFWKEKSSDDILEDFDRGVRICKEKLGIIPTLPPIVSVVQEEKQRLENLINMYEKYNRDQGKIDRARYNLKYCDIMLNAVKELIT